MPYYSDGTLTSSKLQIDDTDGWDTQTEWEAYQSKNQVNITNGTVELEFLEAPQSVLDNRFVHYAADELSLSDGDAVTTWPDLSDNGYDLTGGSPTFNTNVMNGLPGVNFDGVDDGLTNANAAPSGGRPFTAFMVVDNGGTFFGDNHTVVSFNSTEFAIVGESDSSHWRFYLGNDVVTSGSASSKLLTAVDTGGTGSAFREDGTEIGTGDPGARAWDGLAMGQTLHADGSYWENYIHEVIIYDKTATTTEIDEAEQYLADKWGITI